MNWLPDTRQINIPSVRRNISNGTIQRIVLANVGLEIDQAVEMYDRVNSCPHLTADVRTGEIVQHLSFGEVSFGLDDKPSSVLESGKSIIIALLGRSEDVSGWPNAWLETLAEILRPLIKEFDIALTAPPFLHALDSTARFGPEQWDDVRGICGMQHVPYIQRIDPEQLNIDAVFAALRPSVKALPDFSRELKKNSKSKAVSTWQTALGLEVTGIFDDAAVTATVRLQEFLGLDGTGIVDQATWEGAQSLVPTVDVLGPFTGMPLKHGSVGTNVAKWQEQIGISPTGVFDQVTVDATIEYQQSVFAHGNGIVDEATWTKARFRSAQ